MEYIFNHISYTNFLKRVAYLLGNEQESIASLLDCWEDLIESCTDGYTDIPPVFDLELGVRNRIQLLAEDEIITNLSEWTFFQAKLTELDKKLQFLAHPNYQFERGKYWWEKLVLRYAGIGYASWFKDWDIKLIS